MASLYAGAFGIDGGLLVAPGDPSRSILYYRLAKMGGGHMPRAGSREVDREGLAVIREWIEGMGKSEVQGKSEVDGNKPEGRKSEVGARELLTSTRGALLLSILFDRGALTEEVRREVLAVARNHSRSEVRDLFERFVPEGERTRRLGADFRAEEVLGLAGDAARGREIFAAGSAASCRSCHAVQGSGGTVGPDLSQIGKKYGRAEFLRELIDPSREVAPEYTAYLLQTRDGRVHTGLLVERNEKEVVLKDAQGGLLRVEASKVGSLEKRRESLMPELLLQELTAQGAADLIEYLQSLK